MIGQMVTWIYLDFGDPYLYFDIDRFQTFQPPSHANLEVLGKKAQKNLEIGTSSLATSKICVK